MSALGVLLALTAQIVTLAAADLPDKPVYLRVGVGVDSRLTLPEGLVRLHGQRSTSDLLGLKLGQARPKAVLLLHPRSAGTGRLLFVGPAYTLRLVVEASTLGAAQDVELRISSTTEAAQAPTRASTARPTVDGEPRLPPPSPRPTPPAAAAAVPGLDGVPTPPVPSPRPTPLPVGARAPSLDGAPRPPAPSPEPAPSASARADAASIAAGRTAAASAPAAALRLDHRIALPGQPVIFIEEVRGEAGRMGVRLRVEGGAHAEIARLEIAGAEATATAARAGRDLVVVSSIPWPEHPPSDLTLVLVEAGQWRTATVSLDIAAVHQLFTGGSP